MGLLHDYRTAEAAGDLGAAMAALAALEQRHPSATQWPFERAQIHAHFGDHDNAIRAYRRVVEIDPNHLHAMVNLALHLDESRCYLQALALYDQALKLPGGASDPICHGNRGNTLLSLNRFEEARSAFERSLELEPASVAQRGYQTALGCLGHIEECNAARPPGAYDLGPLFERTRQVSAGRLVARLWTGQHTRPDLMVQMAEALLDFCMEKAAVAPGIKDGVTIRHGWSNLVVRAHEGQLVLCEPDFSADPWHRMKWSVGFTLQTQIMQQMMAETTQTALTPFLMEDLVAVDPRTLHTPAVEMLRIPQTDAADLWLIAPTGVFDHQPNLDGFQPMRSGDLVRYRHPLIKASLLPVGHRVRFHAHAVTSVRDPAGHELWDH